MSAEFNKNFPYRNPANDDDLTGILQQSFMYFMKKCDGVLPGKVLAYDRESNTAQIQVMINKVGTSGEIIPGKQLPNIPVMTMGGGNFVMNFALKAGDLGYVVAMDRNISAFLKSLKAASPPVYTIKDYTSSVFIPTVIRGYTISSEDDDSLVIQNLSGSVKFSLSDERIKISAPEVIIEGQTESTINFINPEGGNLYVKGNIQAEGSITPDVPPPP